MFHTSFDEPSLTWSGLPIVPLYNKNVSVGQVVLEALDNNRHKIGQINVNNGIEMTNGEIRLKAVRVAQHLQSQGFNKNHIFAFVASNNHNIASVVFGTLTIGAAVSTLDPSYSKNELVHMFQQTNPSLVFCEAQNIVTVNAALAHLNRTVTVYCFDGAVNGSKSIEELFEKIGDENMFVSPDIGDGTKQIAFIACSSGTTGFPKGVCLSHAASLTHLYTPMMAFLQRTDVTLALSSLYWSSTIGLLISSTLKGALRINITDKFSPDLTLRVIEKYACTLVMTSPTIVAMLVESPLIGTVNLASITTMMCGGSKVYEHIRQKMNFFLPNGELRVLYGMSEPGGILTMNYPTSVPGSVGKMAPKFQAKILDDENGKCGIGVNGEICFRSTYPLLGYYRNETATDELMLDDGYFRTGDIGHFDVDGNLFLVDRKKDILKYMSNHVSPSEIENVILQLNGVKLVSVVGVPDVKYMDLPAAVIVRNGVDDVTEDDVRAIVKDNLPETKQLYGGIYFVDCLPMTPSGKVLRRKAKDMAIQLYENLKNKKQ